ncbi:MAG: ABC transporter ATP-binding protein [Candidatus Micrarchaeota archaeon]
MYFEASLQKKFNEFDLDMAITARKGEFISILGPSGSGKSTLLNMIAGLLEPNAGKILLDGADISSLPPERRNFGMVFQDKLLFPHMTVLENVQFGLKMHKMDLNLAKKALLAVGLEKFHSRGINSLSGGEKQRLAIARAIAYRPRLFLLDEPLKELDAVVKERIKIELKSLQKSLGITTIYVTHDVDEAFYLSDRVYLIHGGKIMQSGRPLDVFKKPANAFVKKYFSPYVLIKISGKSLLARKTSFSENAK